MTVNFRLFALSLLGCMTLFFGCNSSKEEGIGNIATDEETLLIGEVSFSNNCSSCHNFQQDGIGPHLGGLTETVEVSWIRDFIKNPTEMIEAGDERALALFATYKTYMPAFNHLPDEEIDAIIAYVHQHDAPLEGGKIREDHVLDPIKERVTPSGLVVDLELVAEIPPSSENLPLTRIAKMDCHPGTRKCLMLDLRGKLYLLDEGGPRIYMDMEELMPDFINQPGLATGFGNFAFHPDFVENGLFYTTHTEKPGSGKADFYYADSIKVTLQWVVSEWKTTDPYGVPFIGEQRELFRIDMVSGVHGVQEITFNPLTKVGDEEHGLLYIGIGDGGSVIEGFPFIPHGPDRAWGSIFRIDPSGHNSRNGKYGIPRSNPFVGNDEGMLEEIYAHGFRNPHRLSWTKRGQKLATNIGERQLESIYMIEAGDDAGWPLREGNYVIEPDMDISLVYPLPDDDSDLGYNYPVVMYDRDEGRAISGGFEYWGNSVPGLEGKYFFGDIVTGRLFYVETASLEKGQTAPIKEWNIRYKGEQQDLVKLTGNKRVDLRFGRDLDGELYLFTKPDGKVYKMTSTN